MYRIPATVLILLVLAFTVSSQSASGVLKAANKSLGGEKVLKTVRSVSMSGIITRVSDGATGRYHLATSPQGLFSERYDLAGFEVATGYNGKSGWIRDSRRDGLRTLTGDGAKYFQAEAIYRDGRWIDAKADKLKLVAGPTAEVDGVKYKSVIVTNPKGVQMTLFFDITSGRLSREEFMTPEGVKAIDYDDYRVVSNIATPFLVTISKGGDVYKIALDNVTYNGTNDLALFAYPISSGEPLPDIPDLLRQVRSNADKVSEILENYSYTQLSVQREPDKTGRLIEKSSEKRELTFYKGRRINRLIEKNGKPLTEAEQEAQGRDAADRVNDIDKEEAKRAKDSAKDSKAEEENRRISLSDALKGSLLINPRRERFKSRDVIVFDYEPNPAFKPQTRNERLFALCSGAVWVDVSTKQVVRLEAYLTKSAGNFLAKAKQGASFVLDNELVNDEIWLPSQADVNLSVKILFAGININNLIKYGDYRRFRTEVEGAKVGEPIKP